MMELEASERNDPGPTAEESGRRTFRRRSATRVLTISGFILLTVWGLRYAEEAGEVFRIAAADHLGRPWGRVLDPWFVAKTCPHALAAPAGGGRGLLPAAAAEIIPAR